MSTLRRETINNFKKIGEFDYHRVLNELGNKPLWNWLNLRKLANHGDDIILRYQPVQGVMHPMTIMSSLECVDYFTQSLFPKTMELVNQTFEQPIGRVVFARLNPGDKISEHTDEGQYSESTDRFHFVLTTNPEVIMSSGNETHHIDPGEIWWFNNHIDHSVVNNGTTSRIHLIVDTLKTSTKVL